MRRIVIPRPEGTRAIIEAWLAQHGVRGEPLVMRDWESDPAGDRKSRVGAWKAGIFGASDLPAVRRERPVSGPVHQRQHRLDHDLGFDGASLSPVSRLTAPLAPPDAGRFPPAGIPRLRVPGSVVDRAGALL